MLKAPITLYVPFLENGEEGINYSVMPLSFHFDSKYCYIRALKESFVLTQALKTANIDNNECFDIKYFDKFFLKLLSIASQRFSVFITQIDKTCFRVQQKMKRSLKNRELLHLLDLQRSALLFERSITANLKMQGEFFDKWEQKQDCIRSILYENEQVLALAESLKETLQDTATTFSAVISNNQNIVMKLLTAITICLTVPNVISSLWGMNVKVPFAHNPLGFLIIIISVVAILVPVIIIMIRKRMF